MAISGTQTFTAQSNDNTMAFTDFTNIAPSSNRGVNVTPVSDANGVITIEVDGRFPRADEEDTITVDLRPGTLIGANSSPPGLAATTATVMGTDTVNVGQNGGTSNFTVQTNGNFEVMVIRSTGSGTFVEDDGTFTNTTTATDAGTVFTLTQSGRVSPVSGGAGMHNIVASIEHLPWMAGFVFQDPMTFEGSIPFSGQVNSLYEFRIVAPGTTTALDSFFLTQSIQGGTANYKRYRLE